MNVFVAIIQTPDLFDLTVQTSKDQAKIWIADYLKIHEIDLHNEEYPSSADIHEVTVDDRAPLIN